MNLIHHRFSHSILARLAAMRERRERFQRLMKDRPTGVRVETKAKSPGADLRANYRRDMLVSSAITAAIHLIAAIGYPLFEVQSAAVKQDQIIIVMEDIPETRQIVRPPPPPRPSVPIAVETDDVPEDVTIESTDLDFDEIPLDLTPPPPPGEGEAPPAEEEIIEFWKVEIKPKVVKQVVPDYPEVARRAGMEGTVHCMVLIGKDGTIEQVQILKGDGIFAKAATEAVLEYVFSPAMQNDRPVRVWMVIPMHFRMLR